GNAYVTGSTSNKDLPVSEGGLPYSGGYSTDAYVVKLNTTGTALAYVTYLGGSRDDFGRGIAVDSAGNAYVLVFTYSGNFPTTAGSFRPTVNGLQTDTIAVAKLSLDDAGHVFLG